MQQHIAFAVASQLFSIKKRPVIGLLVSTLPFRVGSTYALYPSLAYPDRL